MINLEYVKIPRVLFFLERNNQGYISPPIDVNNKSKISILFIFNNCIDSEFLIKVDI